MCHRTSVHSSLNLVKPGTARSSCRPAPGKVPASIVESKRPLKTTSAAFNSVDNGTCRVYALQHIYCAKNRQRRVQILSLKEAHREECLEQREGGYRPQANKEQHIQMQEKKRNYNNKGIIRLTMK